MSVDLPIFDAGNSAQSAACAQIHMLRSMYPISDIVRAAVARRNRHLLFQRTTRKIFGPDSLRCLASALASAVPASPTTIAIGQLLRDNPIWSAQARQPVRKRAPPSRSRTVIFWN